MAAGLNHEDTNLVAQSTQKIVEKGLPSNSMMLIKLFWGAINVAPAKFPRTGSGAAMRIIATILQAPCAKATSACSTRQCKAAIKVDKRGITARTLERKDFLNNVAPSILSFPLQL